MSIFVLCECVCECTHCAQLGSLALLSSALSEIFFVFGVGVSNCDKLLGCPGLAANSGAYLWNGLAPGPSGITYHEVLAKLQS